MKAFHSSSSDFRFIFDSGRDLDGGCARIFSNPVEIITADEISQVPKAIENLNMAIDKGLFAAGFFSYELGYVLEPSLHSLMPEGRRVPLVWFALYRDVKRLKGGGLAKYLEGQNGPQGGEALRNIRREISREQYLQRFKRVKELIKAGDLYQVNLAFKLLFEYSGSPLALYRTLRERQPVSYGACLETPDFSILSVSPELFFKIDKGRIYSRPMKGTIRRGRTKEEDVQLCEQLRVDPKNRAENLMIVDLMRNDIARICEVGSVQVSDLYRVDPYPSLYQMTSGVQGSLRSDARLAAVIQALVPAGSITGAPKIRAQQVIRDLEEGARGLYCGAMGILNRDLETGQLSALFNVAIRTLTLFPGGSGEAGVGSAIVQDSVGEDEYEECLLKAKFMTQPDFKLIETMRLEEKGDYFLLELHLDRLRNSSKRFGFLCPLDEIRAALEGLAKRLQKSSYLVRLVLDVKGHFELTSTQICALDSVKQITFILSDKVVESTNELLGHKTTRRQLFDEEWTRANGEEGADEVLFLNEKGELTEGSRTNLFIERDGKLLTPPLLCGLLPGTLREKLLTDNKAIEAVLMVSDLKDAKIYLGNSVRGLQPAQKK